MHYSTLLAVVSTLLAASSNAADFAVTVGPGLSYSPDHVTGAAVGDTVTFTFAGGSHTVTQSTLATPCSKFAGGFDSGTGTGTYVVTVNNTQPLWIYCATPGHCRSGMVFAINAASDADLATFQQNAANPSASAPPTTSGASSTPPTTSGASTPGTTTTAAAATTSKPNTGFSTTSVGSAVFLSAVLVSIAGLVM